MSIIDESGIQKDNENFETNASRANELIKNDNWDTAFKYLKEAVDADPNYAEGFNLLGIYHTRNHNYSEAIENFRKALNINFDLIDAHYNLASLYMEQEEYGMALPHFKEVVLVNPEDSETYNLMGICCAKSGKDEDAKAFFSEALRLQPDNVSAAVNIAKLLIKNNEVAEAKGILLYFIKKDIANFEVHHLLGIVYKTQEDFPRALHHLREAVLEDKNNAEAYNLLGECCVKMNLDKQAESFFVMAARLDTAYLDAYYNLGNLYYNQQKYHDAVLALEEYVRTKEATDFIDSLWSDNESKDGAVPLYNLLGNCYKMINNPVKARAIWEKSLSIQPEQQEIKEAVSGLSQTSQMHKRISLVID
ncbi:MAG: tetratricopeptide repeat protein [Candidatus Kuenenia sp.]|nr:tetratricopeptide repeat protein [Candidatus Kuenenia hertensis]